MRKEEQPERDLRITDQHRAKRGMLYDMRCRGSRLIINIAPRENDLDPDSFRVEARASNAPDATVITAWGATRAEALRAAGRTWTASAASRGLPAFDWDDVALVLNQVRALREIEP